MKLNSLGFFLVLSLVLGFSLPAAHAAITPPEALIPAKSAGGESARSDLFFGHLDPHVSGHGSVKTFSIKVHTPRLDQLVSRPSRTRDIVPPPDTSQVFSGESFMMPVGGKITSLFGYRQHPRRRSQHFHSGVDISAPRGTPFRAAAGGVVVFAGWRSGYGQMIVVDHGSGLQTVYAHCSSMAVRAGQRVRAGANLGQVGRTGMTTGPHLHFEVRRDGNFRNPMRYLPN
jgi:murein DD-endopeptidase MepM/ murein hydrolase activator NlpD